jgi:hypothetical protein
VRYFLWSPTTMTLLKYGLFRHIKFVLHIIHKNGAWYCWNISLTPHYVVCTVYEIGALCCINIAHVW